jgi:DNA modification methylase
MAGSGTMAEVALKHGRKVVVSDMSEDYTKIMEQRLGVKRTKIK